jgi:high-affinity nickel-transport protein
VTVGSLAAGNGWTRAERTRLSAIVGAVAVLHLAGWSLYLSYATGPLGAGAFAGAGTLAYTLGVRHAFDADHIAAIDDTTRLMMQRGRRPVGVGFFFALGHSSVVIALALVVALAAGAADDGGLASFRSTGAVVSKLVAIGFLALVAALNALVLRGLGRLWQRLREGRLDKRELELLLLNRGLVNRILGGRARTLIRSSWHMYPLGLLFGLGLETASEVALLSLSASAASAGSGQAGPVPLLATMSLPLLFAAGMSACDTCDSLLMTRAYSWSHRSPARTLYYSLATTAMTVAAAGFVASVYLAAVLVEHAGLGLLAPYAALAGHFELLGYGIVALFVATWLCAALLWRARGATWEGRRP